jgi:hypothetical protein
MGNLIIKAALSYVEAHPEIVEKLVHAAFDAIVKHLDKSQA